MQSAFREILTRLVQCHSCKDCCDWSKGAMTSVISLSVHSFTTDVAACPHGLSPGKRGMRRGRSCQPCLLVCPQPGCKPSECQLLTTPTHELYFRFSSGEPTVMAAQRNMRSLLQAVAMLVVVFVLITGVGISQYGDSLPRIKFSPSGNSDSSLSGRKFSGLAYFYTY